MLPWPQALERSAYALDAQRFAQLRAERVASIDSTNSALLRLAQQAGQMQPGQPVPPQVLWAEQQSAGRGRMGRQWQSVDPNANANAHTTEPERRSLTFSIGLPFAPQNWSGLSLVVGLAVAEVLGPDLALKWPNDVCVRRGAAYAKLGGILLETQALPWPQTPAERWLVIGLGLNLQGLPQGDLRSPAIDLAQALPAAQAADCLADVPALCSRLVLAILQAILRFESSGFAPFAAAFAARDVLLGQSVVTRSEQGQGEAGLALGVAADGSYHMRLADGRVHAIHSAEISLRPAAAAGVLSSSPL